MKSDTVQPTGRVTAWGNTWILLVFLPIDDVVMLSSHIHDIRYRFRMSWMCISRWYTFQCVILWDRKCFRWPRISAFNNQKVYTECIVKLWKTAYIWDSSRAIINVNLVLPTCFPSTNDGGGATDYTSHKLWRRRLSYDKKLTFYCLSRIYISYILLCVHWWTFPLLKVELPRSQVNILIYEVCEVDETCIKNRMMMPLQVHSNHDEDDDDECFLHPSESTGWYWIRIVMSTSLWYHTWSLIDCLLFSLALTVWLENIIIILIRK